jgi:hypothetical protein
MTAQKPNYPIGISVIKAWAFQVELESAGSLCSRMTSNEH